MILVTRNGRTTVLTGWRAWLASAVIFASGTVTLAFVVFVVLGLAVSIGSVLLIVLPVALGIVILASLFRSSGAR